MARYEILYERKAVKALRDLDNKSHKGIVAAIDKLSEDPRPNGCKKLQASNFYRIRVGFYRVIYEVNDGALIVRVINVGDRKEIYRHL